MHEAEWPGEGRLGIRAQLFTRKIEREVEGVKERESGKRRK